MTHWLEPLLLALLLTWSLWFTASKLLPAPLARLQNRLGDALLAHGLPRLGQWLRSHAGSAAAGCDSGCSSCHGCSTTAVPDAQPVQIRPSPRQQPPKP